MENYLSLKEVMEKTKLKYSTVIKYAILGILPASIIKNGKKSKYLFPEKELEKKLKNFRVSVV